MKTLKPFFNSKASNPVKITSVKNDAIISDDKEIVKTMNRFLLISLKGFLKMFLWRMLKKEILNLNVKKIFS